MSWYEDFLLSNVRSFAENGITAIKIQDETVTPGPAAPRTVARMAALGHAVRRTFPDLTLGIIVQAHDATAAMDIADACDASFIRQKVFAGAAITAEGLREALGPQSVAHRQTIARRDIHIYADVQDRTSAPMGGVISEQAARWTQQLGADALVITGSTFDDTLARIDAARRFGVTAPILIGGSVTTANVRQALEASDGVIVSSSLVRPDAERDAFDRWDPALIRQFIEAANP